MTRHCLSQAYGQPHDAEKKFNRIMKNRLAYYNQRYWWKKGQITPEVLR